MGRSARSSSTSERRWRHLLSKSSARTARWSEPSGATTCAPRTSTAPLTRMWSIWLCGRQAGQVLPSTARRKPGMADDTIGPQQFMSPRTTVGNASFASRSESARIWRSEPRVKCPRCVPATRSPFSSSTISATRLAGSPPSVGNSATASVRVGIRDSTARFHEPRREAKDSSPGRARRRRPMAGPATRNARGARLNGRGPQRVAAALSGVGSSTLPRLRGTSVTE